LTVAVLGAGLLCSGLAVRSGLAQDAARAPDGGVVRGDIVQGAAQAPDGGVVRGGAPGAAQAQDRRLAGTGPAVTAGAGVPAPISFQEQNALIGRFCLRCHNDAMRTGGLSLESFDAGRAHERAEVAEKMILKLQAGMMPPATAQRPDAAAYASLVASLSRTLDEAAAADPRPGGRSFQRLNRAEYARSIEELLGLRVDAAAFLPPDTISAGFDNIADVQGLSATLMDGYLRAAGEISRLAVGDPQATPRESTYEVSRYASQTERAEGAPFGTRGGLSVVHTFPADGDYVFRVALQHESTGNLFGNGRGALHTAAGPEQLEISVDGERVAVLEVDRWGHRQEEETMEMRSEPVFVRAGPQRVSAAFLKRFEGPVEDLLSPHEWSLADKKIGYSYGITTLPHLRDLVVGGPFGATGVSETPVRRRIFTCRPTAPEEEGSCASAIVGRLASQAYRRPLADGELGALLRFYELGVAEGGFEAGVRTALQAILASPDFVFRFEEPEGSVAPGEAYRLDDVDLASRLSFFLWAKPPDNELLGLAAGGRLSLPDVLERQVRRMLADPRAEALGSRFAAQWLRLQDLDKVHPDSLRFPDFHQQLADSMRRETELFFANLVRQDRSALEMLTADYTFVNERLARHYGIRGVVGPQFRRVELPGERRGLLGHGSILTLTSHANRTSPVLRGKWVMEVLLGTPPPPPPPDVPDLEEPDAAADARTISVREQMEEHRANPACMSCHSVIDPIGLALENYDVTGAWRIKDNGVPVDPSGELYDGSLLDGPAGLRRALLGYSDAVLSNFTVNLMAYALGRRVEYRDMPAVRAIVREAAANDYRMSSFILGVARSTAFRYNLQTTTNDPQAGSADSRSGGADPQAGGADSRSGGADPQAGGADSRRGGADPQAGGADSRSEDADPRAGSVRER
jgi:hypothetical protein